jgi:Protein of unknown function (DUF4240)
MEWERFWGLVGVLRGSVDEAAIARLIAEVAEYPPAEIESFDDRLHEAVHALDGPAWFDQPVTDPAMTAADLQAFLAELESGGGDDALRSDGFLFARAAVVAAGRKTYEEVLADPRLFAGDRDSRAQRLLFVAQRAYEQRQDDHYDHVPPVDAATGTNAELWGRGSAVQHPD